jgi:TatD DNase family protein
MHRLWAHTPGVGLGHHRRMTVWIDTHCHLDAPELAADVAAVRRRAQAAGVAHCVLPAVQVANFENVRLMAHQFGDSYALGIHPLCTPRAQDADLALLDRRWKRHADDPRLVAVGEIGLDYFAPGLDDARAAALLPRAAAPGAKARAAGDRARAPLGRQAAASHLRELPVAGGIAHAFNGSLQQAQAFVAMGFKLGFGGAATFDRALQIRTAGG